MAAGWILGGTATGSLERIAHRCRGYGALEQSPQAIAAAIADGATPHLATHLTADGKWVVLTGSEDARLVRAAHARTGPRSRSIALPLEHALALVAARGEAGTRLYLEAKDVGGERALVAALTRIGILDRIILLAWDPEILRRAHRIAPTLLLGIAFVPLERSLARSRAVTHAVRPRKRVSLGYDPAQRFDALPGVGSTPVHALADASLDRLPLAAVCVPAILARAVTVGRAHERGARLIAFGPQRFVLRMLRSRGVDAVMSDHAPALKRG